MWDFPTTEELSGLTSDMASLFTGTEAPGFLIGAPRYQNLTVIQGGGNIDAAAWLDQANGKAMVSVVNLNYQDVSGPVTVSLPTGTRVSGVSGGLWGSSTWEVIGNETVGVSGGLEGLETAVFLLSLV